MSKIKFKYGINEKPKSKLLLFGLSLQHVFAMFGSTVLVPTLIGLDIPTALLTAGIGTLIYAFVTKSKVPVFIGSSFAYIAILSDLKNNTADGSTNVAIAVISVGIIYLLFSLVTKVLGNSWIDKILPPVVIGPIIIVIGMGLAPNAISNSGFSESTFDLTSIMISMSALFGTIIALVYGPKWAKLIPVMIGIVIGYIVALLLGRVDVAPIINTPLFQIPDLFILGVTEKFSWDWGIFLSVIPLVLVTIAEHIGDHSVSGSMLNKNFLRDPGLEKTILGDGLATLVAGFLGGPCNTTYAENTSVIMLTKIASVIVIKVAAIMAICISFIGPVVAVVQSIPSPVMGGISIVLFGMIAQNGIRILINAKIDLLILVIY